MTALLFYGPTAIDALTTEPALRGWFSPKPLYGLEGLKVDEARQLISDLNIPPPSDRVCAYAVNLNRAADRTQDILLKVLEEHDPTRIAILLGVSDVGLVLPTVRSRCHERWCGGDVESPELLGVAQGLLMDWRAGRLAEALEPLKKKQNDPGAMLDALTEVAKTDLEFWSRIKPLHGYHNLTNTDIIGALL